MKSRRGVCPAAFVIKITGKKGRFILIVKYEYPFDFNGNMITKTVYDDQDAVIEEREYTYSNGNKLMSAEITKGSDVTEVSYSYDANGRRIGKTVERTGSNSEEITNETEYVWYGDIIYYEKHTETVTDLSGTTSSSQVMTTMYGQSGITARNDDIYATDGHGSVRRRYSQNNTDEYDYHAFGDEIDPDSTDTNPYRYCGEYTDSESGLIYLRNRYYDPAAGRFISEDPAKDGLNWYAYCGNNPVGFVDPLGLYAEGDENLPYLINYIINGADGKTGGLTAQWYAAKTQEEKNRINKVANMLRCETTDFDITKSLEWYNINRVDKHPKI